MEAGKTGNLTLDANQTVADETLVYTREFNAPRELVFKAWTEAERLAQWWGPKGFKINVEKLEVVPNGVFHYYMETPDGKKMWGKFTYLEVVAPERLVFINGFSDEQCGVTRHPMSDTWPLEVFNTLTLTEKDGKTFLHIVAVPHNANPAERKTFIESRPMVQQGLAGTFEQLDAYLSQA